MGCLQCQVRLVRGHAREFMLMGVADDRYIFVTCLMIFFFFFSFSFSDPIVRHCKNGDGWQLYVPSAPYLIQANNQALYKLLIHPISCMVQVIQNHSIPVGCVCVLLKSPWGKSRICINLNFEFKKLLFMLKLKLSVILYFLFSL